MTRPVLNFGTGFILTAVILPFSKEINVLLTAAMVLIAMAAVIFFIKCEKFRVSLRYISIFSLGVALSLINIAIYTQTTILPLLNTYNQTISVKATVTDVYTSYNTNYYLCKATSTNTKGIPKNIHIELKDLAGDKLKTGESFSANIKISLPKSYKTLIRTYSKGISLNGEIAGDIELLTEDIYPITAYASRLRNSIKDNILFRVNGEIGGVSIALATGDKSYMSQDVITSLSKAGTIHIASVSGMHMSIVTMSILSLLVFMGVKKQLSAAFCLPIPILFGLLCGFSPSIYRSMIMMIITLLGIIIIRRGDTLTSLSIAGILTLIIDPFMGKGLGFMLSYTSTLGIAILYPLLTRYFKPKKKSKLVAFFLFPLYQSVSAWIFLLMITPFFFGYLSLISPLTNMLCSLFTYPSLILSLITGLIPSGKVFNVIGVALGKTIPIFLYPIIKISEVASNMQFFILNINRPELFLALAMCIVIIFVAIIFKGGKMSLAVLPICCGIILLSAYVSDFLLNTNSLTLISHNGYTAISYKKSSVIIYLDNFPPNGNYVNDALSGIKELSVILAPNKELFSTSALSKVIKEKSPTYILHNEDYFAQSYLSPYKNINISPLNNTKISLGNNLYITHLEHGCTEILFNNITLLKKSTECDIIDYYNDFSIVLDKDGEILHMDLPKNSNKYIINDTTYYRFY